MKRRSTAGGNPSKSRGRMAVTPKRRVGPKARRRRSSPAVGQETKVAHIHELRDALQQQIDELQALGEVSQAVNSTLDLGTVLAVIVNRAVQLSRTDAGAIYVFDAELKEFCLQSTYGMSETMMAAIYEQHIGLGDAHVGVAATQRKPIQVFDIRTEPASPVNEIILREAIVVF
jgi:hypothetical protein